MLKIAQCTQIEGGQREPSWQCREEEAFGVWADCYQSALTRPEISGTSVAVNLVEHSDAYSNFGRDDWLLSYATIDLLRATSPNGPFLKVGPTYTQDSVYEGETITAGFLSFTRTTFRVPTGETYVDQNGERVFYR